STRRRARVRDHGGLVLAAHGADARRDDGRARGRRPRRPARGPSACGSRADRAAVGPLPRQCPLLTGPFRRRTVDPTSSPRRSYPSIPHVSVTDVCRFVPAPCRLRARGGARAGNATIVPMRLPVVLFDLDGTVIDSGGIILASMRHAATTVLGRDV